MLICCLIEIFNMKLTPLQIRELVGISQETLRHWRRVLPPLKERSGYAPCFTPGDALALSVIKEIVECLQMRVQVLQPFAEELFNICRGINWPRLEQQSLTLRFSDTKIQACVLSEAFKNDSPCTMLVIDLYKHIQVLRARLTEGESNRQYEIPFPPVSVKKRNIQR
jgi:hypothetical protein